MTPPIVGVLLLLLFVAAHATRERLPSRWRWLPLSLLSLAVFAAGMEMARNPHGRGDLLLWIGFVAAPVVVIFGGAAEGVRRWYGWPDLGPVPGRLALVAASLLLGVLVGARVSDSDKLETLARGEKLAAEIRAWSAAHEGRWPSTLSEVVADPPRTRMGAVSPPSFDYDAAARTLGFPLGEGRSLHLDLADVSSRWK